MRLLLFMLLCSFRVFGQCDSANLRPIASAVFSLHLFDTANMIGVGGNGDIIRTTDAGEHWTRPLYYHSYTYLLSSLHFPTSTIGYAVGSNALLKTEDAGVTWFPLIPPARSLNKVYFLNATKGFILADDGQIFLTTDGGRNWSRQHYFFSESLSGIAFTPNKTGFVCGVRVQLKNTVSIHRFVVQ